MEHGKTSTGNHRGAGPHLVTRDEIQLLARLGAGEALAGVLHVRDAAQIAKRVHDPHEWRKRDHGIQQRLGNRLLQGCRKAGAFGSADRIGVGGVQLPIPTTLLPRSAR